MNGFNERVRRLEKRVGQVGGEINVCLDPALKEKLEGVYGFGSVHDVFRCNAGSFSDEAILEKAQEIINAPNLPIPMKKDLDAQIREAVDDLRAEGLSESEIEEEIGTRRANDWSGLIVR